jgi:hypothetical protein
VEILRVTGDHAGHLPPQKLSAGITIGLTQNNEGCNGQANCSYSGLLLIGRLTVAQADQRGPDWMPTGRVKAKILQSGYSQVTKLEADDGRWEREGIKNGQKMGLIVYRLGQRGLSFRVEPRSRTPPITCRSPTWKAPDATISPGMASLRGAWRGAG